ncbi:unnamed protein product [Cyprideis torosa]|uniref:Uncharacterized protein n=1 Tax=Cyprideis torosa TaxID=163714 RepID=A0A7R8WFJ7_9CRUS|nr:unnamed protein product [Cyprideis torosa]CAG0897083.1 unnamed protein product [Cyprideis torosa]
MMAENGGEEMATVGTSDPLLEADLRSVLDVCGDISEDDVRKALLAYPPGEERVNNVITFFTNPVPDDIPYEILEDEKLWSCETCYDEKLRFVDMFPCSGDEIHFFCKPCVRKSVMTQYREGKTTFGCLNCAEEYSVEALEQLVGAELTYVIRRRAIAKEIRAANVPGYVECPFCENLWIDEHLELEGVVTCNNPRCAKTSCAKCQLEDHRPEPCYSERDEEVKARIEMEEIMAKALIRNCHKCKTAFTKSHGCNKMTCPNCGAFSCYLCKQPITGYDHFGATVEEGKCLLTSDDAALYSEELQAGARTAQEVLRTQHPDVIVKNDPSISVLGKSEEEMALQEQKIKEQREAELERSRELERKKDLERLEKEEADLEAESQKREERRRQELLQEQLQYFRDFEKKRKEEEKKRKEEEEKKRKEEEEKKRKEEERRRKEEEEKRRKEEEKNRRKEEEKKKRKEEEEKRRKEEDENARKEQEERWNENIRKEDERREVEGQKKANEMILLQAKLQDLLEMNNESKEKENTDNLQEAIGPEEYEKEIPEDLEKELLNIFSPKSEIESNRFERDSVMTWPATHADRGRGVILEEDPPNFNMYTIEPTAEIDNSSNDCMSTTSLSQPQLIVPAVFDSPTFEVPALSVLNASAISWPFPSAKFEDSIEVLRDRERDQDTSFRELVEIVATDRLAVSDGFCEVLKNQSEELNVLCREMGVKISFEFGGATQQAFVCLEGERDQVNQAMDCIRDYRTQLGLEGRIVENSDNFHYDSSDEEYSTPRGELDTCKGSIPDFRENEVYSPLSSSFGLSGQTSEPLETLGAYGGSDEQEDTLSVAFAEVPCNFRAYFLKDRARVMCVEIKRVCPKVWVEFPQEGDTSSVAQVCGPKSDVDKAVEIIHRIVEELQLGLRSYGGRRRSSQS